MIIGSEMFLSQKKKKGYEMFFLGCVWKFEKRMKVKVRETVLAIVHYPPVFKGKYSEATLLRSAHNDTIELANKLNFDNY